MRTVCLWAAAAALPAVAGGCDLFQAAAYVLTPDPTQTIEAEYGGLAGQKVAIIVYADQEILYVANADVQTAMYVAQAFKEAQDHGDLRGMELVPVTETIRFQQRSDWYNMRVPQIGRHFNADRVLYIELEEYARREPGSPNLLRGRISATLKVYQVSKAGEPPPRRNPVYATRLGIVWPEDSPLMMSDENLIRVEAGMLARFAKRVARKFYTYKINLRHPENDR